MAYSDDGETGPTGVGGSFIDSSGPTYVGGLSVWLWSSEDLFFGGGTGWSG